MKRYYKRVDKLRENRYNEEKDTEMRQKRGRLEKREKIQETLEAYRRFDYDYLSFGTHWRIPDGSFDYSGSKRKVGSFLIRLITAVVGPVLIKAAYGAKVVGKRNLRALGKRGAVCVTNHFAYLDTLFVRQAVGYYRSYHTVAPWNNKTGVGGWFLHRGGILPFSPNLAATRNLNREIERLLKEGKIVNFYAEQAMWVNYQKPRPMKDGAFRYAVQNDVPVLPVFCTFRKNKRGHMKKLRINILPPVYADESLPKKERAAKLRRDAEAEWKACYESAYGIAAEYLPPRGKKNGA